MLTFFFFGSQKKKNKTKNSQLWVMYRYGVAKKNTVMGWHLGITWVGRGCYATTNPSPPPHKYTYIYIHIYTYIYIGFSLCFGQKKLKGFPMVLMNKMDFQYVLVNKKLTRFSIYFSGQYQYRLKHKENTFNFLLTKTKKKSPLLTKTGRKSFKFSRPKRIGILYFFRPKH